jgi:thiol-disulfide isomerase/thioredoxin
LQPYSLRNNGWRQVFSAARVWDALAVAAVAFALWKIFLVPRAFDAPHAHRAPHAVFARLDGGTFALAGDRGRIVFLDFYASWCEPCKLELPLVERWASAHPQAEVVPIDVGESASAARTFAQRYRLSNVALAASTTAGALFGVVGFPSIVVVDPDGFIRAKWEGLNPAIGLAMSNAQRSL